MQEAVWTVGEREMRFVESGEVIEISWLNMRPMSSFDNIGSTHVLTEVTNESYSGDRPLSKVETRSESATGLAIVARLYMMDLTDWIYSDIEEVPFLTVCSWY